MISGEWELAYNCGNLLEDMKYTRSAKQVKKMANSAKKLPTRKKNFTVHPEFFSGLERAVIQLTQHEEIKLLARPKF